jgi:DNA-binding protein H-NS
MNLNEMSVEELDTLEKDIAMARVHAENTKITNAMEQIFSLMDKLHVTPDQVLPEIMKRKNKKTKLPPKYVSPDNEKQTWSGVGRKPNWFIEQLDKGVELETMAV